MQLGNMSISITPKTFMGKLTQAEVVAIFSSVIPEVIYFRTLFLASERIVSDDPNLMPGINLLVTAGLLTNDRKDEIMAWAKI